MKALRKKVFGLQCGPISTTSDLQIRFKRKKWSDRMPSTMLSKPAKFASWNRYQHHRVSVYQNSVSAAAFARAKRSQRVYSINQISVSISKWKCIPSHISIVFVRSWGRIKDNHKDWCKYNCFFFLCVTVRQKWENSDGESRGDKIAVATNSPMRKAGAEREVLSSISTQISVPQQVWLAHDGNI